MGTQRASNVTGDRWQVAGGAAVAGVLLLAGIAPAQLAFDASVDRTQVEMDDQLTLTLTVSGANAGGAQPQLPQMSGFSVAGRSTSTQMRFDGRRMSYNLTFQYALVPTKMGKQTIPPATLSFNGQVLKTKPITVTVIGGTTTQPRQPAQPSQPAAPAQPSGPAVEMAPGHSEDEETGNVFLKATVDKTEVYVNEQVTLDVSAYRRIRWYDADADPPELVGFIGFDLPKLQREVKSVNGVQYVRQPWLRKALFPTAAGEQTIGKAALRFTVDFFGGRTYEVTSKPIAINVLPLPEEGKPRDFNGAVGQFDLQVSIDKRQLNTDDAVTLKATVTGTGNIASVTELSLGDLSKFRQFKGNQTEETSVQGLQLAGTKKFEFVLVPLEPGQLTLGPVALHYFNPQTKQYESAQSEPLVLTVTEGTSGQSVDAVTGFTKEEIRLLKKDINYIRPDVKRLRDEETYVFRKPGFLLLNGLPLLALGVATLYRRQQARLAEDEGYQRLRRGNEASDRALSDAERQLKKQAAAEFYRDLSLGLREFVGSRLNIPPAGVSADTTPATLRVAGVSDELVAQIESCLRQCEAGRFAPGAAEPEVMRQALGSARSCLAELDRVEVAPS